MAVTPGPCGPGGCPPPIEIDCIFVNKVFDYCFQSDTVPLVCADFVCGGTITSVTSTVVDVSCSFQSSTPSSSPNFVNATFLVTALIDFTIVTTTTICYTFATTSFIKTVTLCGPTGTVQSCEVLSATTAPPFVLDGAVFTSVTFCETFESTASVKLVVPSYGYCSPAPCQTLPLLSCPPSPLFASGCQTTAAQAPASLGSAARFAVRVGRLRAAAAQAPVNLGTAASFGVLAGSTVTNTGPSIIAGNLGVSPGSAVTGFPPGTVTGTIHAADAVAAQAQIDLTTAYNDAASRGPATPVTGDLGGQTLVPGVYSGGALGLTGTLTLDAQGNPNAVFIFQAASTLITASASAVVLVNGANACNVFWQVGSSATLGTTSVFVGTILALTSITATTGALVMGRLLARNGAVTLDSNDVTVPNCPPASSCSQLLSATIPG